MASLRASDPHHCNKCGAAMTYTGLCSEDCTLEPTPASRTVRRSGLIGQAHLGRLAAPIDEAA